ncbi:S-adenosyl-L-methionine-dependent methyltransferase [Podospora australis]|uniref:S-adenosyl-L-methionine-dependent methyltransferase n=1 Tax=Podospora australis TaxID=1536484 RepID=A0AAN6WMT0_9PEZI|nr:S-adenosyl-L-methionine-dependent methyltransferase [Podospora australis]
MVTNSASGGAVAAIEELVQALTKFKTLLFKPEIHAEIHRKLHVSEEGQLPDKEIVPVASRAVDVLHELEQLLQPTQLVLADHFLGYTSSKCLVGALELQIPDLLAKSKPGTMTISELAEAAGAREDRLLQILRTLSCNGIFTVDSRNGTVSNNFRSEHLRSNHWTQWHNWVDLYGNEFYDIARGIPASLKKDTKRSAAQHNFDTDDDMFTYFDKQGWVPRLHRTLGGGAIAMAPGIVADYPWDELAGKTILDVGGGGGALIASLLRGHRGLRGGVFDLPRVIEHIRPFFREGGQFADVADRVSQTDLIAGDFFDTKNFPRYEVYVMKWCLHDWRDPEAIKILQNVRKAMVPGERSRLVVLESVMGDKEMTRLSRYGDINMMMTAKGLERTADDWQRLAKAAGWAIRGVHTMRNAWVSAIEMRPA